MTLKRRQFRFYPQIPISIGILLVLGVLYVAKAVIVPLVVAILLAFVLTPVVMALQRLGLRRVYGVVVAVLLALSAFGVAGYIVGTQFHSLAVSLPKHRGQIETKFAALREGGGAFAEVLQMFRREIRKKEADAENPETAKERNVVVTRQEESSSAEKALQTAAAIVEPLAQAGFVVILVIFMLYHREDLRNRFIGLLGDGRLAGTTRVLVDSAQRISRYLFTQSLINLGFGLLFALGLSLIQVEYAFLWGFVTFLMRFIPYIGTWIAVLLPFTLSFATSSSWAQPLTLVAYFSILEVVTANFIEPLLLGHRTGVSPIALLVAAAFWTWLWGPMGLVLSTPLTVCLVVLGQHVPRLQFFALLLGDEPPLEPRVRFYQRLLARDEVEARAVAVEIAQAGGPEKLYDNVLLPVLVMARQDRREAGLEAEDEEFIVNTTRDILRSLETPPAQTAAADKPPQDQAGAVGALPTPALTQEVRRVVILGCPVHHQVEDVALQMLARLVKPDGCELKTVSSNALPWEIEARIERTAPALAFIAVVPPGGLVQARYLCKRLRRRFANLPIVVGYLGEARDVDTLFRQLRSAGATFVATTLLQARNQIVSLVQPAAPHEPPPLTADPDMIEIPSRRQKVQVT